MRLLGRETELGTIATVLEAVDVGQRRILVVSGELGIGKTRLLDAVREQAKALRFTVISGRASELEVDVPFAAAVDAFEGQLGDMPDARLRSLGDEQLAYLATVFPALHAMGRSGSALDSPSQRWRAYRALRDLIGLVAGRRPAALIIDDLHWADEATFGLLEYLVRRPPDDPHLLVLGSRPTAALERLLEARTPNDGAELVSIDLRPLDRLAAEPLLTPIGDSSDRDRVFLESGGNPLFLEELVRFGFEGEPPMGISAAVRSEVRTLTAPARALLAGAAISGDPFELDLATAVAELGRDDGLQALDTLLERTLVRETEDARRFAFRHPVVRSAVYASLPTGVRLAAHHRAANALSTMGAPLAARARHLFHSAQPGDFDAAVTLRSAAAVVRSRAPAIAADWLRAARRADPAPSSLVLTELAETLVDAGRLEEALVVVDDPSVIPNDADETERVRLCIAGASVERLLGRHLAAKRRLELALADTRAQRDASALLMANVAFSSYQSGDPKETGRWAERALTAADGDLLVSAAASALLAPAHLAAGQTNAARAAAADAVERFAGASDAAIAAAGDLVSSIPWGVLGAERLADGLSIARRAGSAVRRHGTGPAIVAIDVAAVLALGLLGRITEAVAAADDAEQTARITGNAQAVQWALWMKAWTLLESGSLDAALVAADESTELGEALDASALATIGRTVRGAVLVARGEFEAGRELVALYDVDPGWICRWSPALVQASIALGDLELARAQAASASALAAVTGLAGPLAAGLRSEALVALAEDDFERGARLARDAIASARSIGGVLDEARGRLLVGRALGPTDRSAAIRELETVSGQAIESGASGLHDEAVRELRKLGHRVGRGGRRAGGEQGIGSLSGREREVADLVAVGSTNREIAGRLFLSEKTVERHLSHVFRKLDVRSRAEVAACIAVANHE